jgi:multimeric flavodoxin WrbA
MSDAMPEPSSDETNPLRAVTLNCSLKPSAEPSSTDVLAGQLLEALRGHGVVTGPIVRVADHDVRPGVELDMGSGDAWPRLREQVMAADILVLATPTWMGQQSSVCQRVLERLDAELSELDDQGRPLTFGKVAVAVVVGNEDGAHHISGVLFQGLNDVGFSIPAQGVTYWNGRAMETTDYRDLDETPESVATTTATVAAHAAHLAGLLRTAPYPAT